MSLTQLQVYMLYIIFQLVLCENSKEIRASHHYPANHQIQISENQLLTSLKAVMNSQFVQQMANNIASKAVQRIVSELKKQHIEATQISTIENTTKYKLTEVSKPHSYIHDKEKKDIARVAEQENENPTSDRKPKATIQPKSPSEVENDDVLDQKGEIQPAEIVTETTKISRFLRPSKKNKQRQKKPSPESMERKKRLSEQIALQLLREPNPDGDNLGLDSLESPKAQEVQPMRINGRIMRRVAAHRTTQSNS